MQHEQEYCAHALQAEEQRRQAAAPRAKVIADGANDRHRQAEAAIGERRRQAATARGNALAQATAERRRREAAAASTEFNLAEVQHLEDALTEETRRRAALAEAKRHENALAAEERQRAALAKS
jgi:hypothetical protein